MIDPVAVRDVNEAVDHKVEIFIEDEPAASFMKSPLGRSIMEGIYMPELPEVVPAMRGRKASLLDIPTFYAASVPTAHFSDARLRKLTENMFTYIRREVERVEDSGEVVPVLQAILGEQLAVFPQNAQIYIDHFGTPFAKRIRTVMRPMTGSTHESAPSWIKRRVGSS